ncbi:MAG: polysaccharide deacetylase family protein [Gemmatimonadetes bacterium]|nr:polysaccharide deacetylase family protein [Gemmatimonadota bacterium]
MAGGCGDGRDAGAGSAGDAPDAAVATSPDDSLPALAITIDDLPWVGPLPPGRDRAAATRQILAALEAHGVRATGFVNCGRVQPGAPILGAWLDAGQALGNHTSEHMDLNRAEPAAWAADARECDAFLRELTGESSLPFRYPYLHRGPTAERLRAGRAVLEALGSTVAPVTIDTGDWIIDDAYVAALEAGDDARARAIADAYLAHVTRAARHYRQVAEERLGRDVPHILLLHANALLAEQLDALLTRLEQEGFRFVPLERALEDPVYALEDDYIGPDGLSWLYRIPPATPDAAAWDNAEAAALRALIR